VQHVYQQLINNLHTVMYITKCYVLNVVNGEMSVLYIHSWTVISTRQPLLQRRSRHQRINTYCQIDPTANNTDRHTTSTADFLSPVHTGDKVERTFNIRATKFATVLTATNCRIRLRRQCVPGFKDANLTQHCTVTAEWISKGLLHQR